MRAQTTSGPEHELLLMTAVALQLQTGEHAQARKALAELHSDVTNFWKPPDGRGPTPVAYYSGWNELCGGDKGAAARASRALRDFANRQRKTVRSEWYLQLLLADASLFQGNLERSVAYAKEAVRLVPRDGRAMEWMEASSNLAAVYAWSGAHAQATEILEELARVMPGLDPAAIARNEMYSKPLSAEPRYQALVAQLEAQMRATKLSP